MYIVTFEVLLGENSLHYSLSDQPKDWQTNRLTKLLIEWHASDKLSISIHFLMIKTAFSVVLFVQIPQKYKWNFDRVQQKNTLEERFFGQWQYLLKCKTPLLEFFFNVWRVYTSFLKTMKRYSRNRCYISRCQNIAQSMASDMLKTATMCLLMISTKKTGYFEIPEEAFPDTLHAIK